MDNQHRKIVGYRELSEEDIALMNKIKELGPSVENVLLDVARHIEAQRKHPKETVEECLVENQRLDNATPERFLAIAKTHLQEGLMSATRAVAQPEFF